MPNANLRNKKHREFYDLEVFPFTSAQKTWAVKEILGENDPDDLNRVISAKKFANRYRINENTVKSWVQRYKSGNGNLHSETGRPMSLDEIAKEKLIEVLKTKRKGKKSTFSSSTSSLMYELANETNERRNQHPKVNRAGKLDNKTEHKIKKQLGIVRREAQSITDARIKAGFDVRMTYTMWCMLKAFTSDLWHNCIWNIDATQFVINEKHGNDTVDIVKDEDDSSPVTTNSQGKEMGIAIKWMQMGSAAGVSCPTVLMCALKDMDADECYVVPIRGLTHTIATNQIGFLVFCKSRAGNRKFFKWFVENIVIPTTTAERDFNECKVIPYENILLSPVITYGQDLISLLSLLFLILVRRRHDHAHLDHS